ncbi:MAG: dihydropteroate synthase [bacterium]
MRNANQNKFIVINGKIIDTTDAIVMSIINATPDSFYANSRVTNDELIIASATNAISNGATILDVGGYSTRPGAPLVTEDEEIERVGNALKIIRSHFPEIPISIDTFRARVAEIAVKEYGVNMINDVSAFELDEKMLDMIVELQVPYILMHSKGDSQTMQNLTQYDDLIPEILQFFAWKIGQLRDAGFNREIIIDPGFGFAKEITQNYKLLKELKLFECFNTSILVGISRKSMIFKQLGITPNEALNGTTVLNSIALERGANILRVHDTKEAMEAIKLCRALRDS